MEFFWSPTQDSKVEHSLLGICNYNLYQPPPGFCFDIFCQDTPVMFDPRLENYNLPEMAGKFAAYFKDMAKHYRQPIIQITMGSDFMYINAEIWYKNIDYLIDYVNAHPELYNMEIIYSTPEDYLEDIHNYNA
jgi:lysosomal alpha-mannosidase